ncbi:MAG: PQQ-dependent sugar dehydrogenase [Phycisphaerales bacterium]
MGFSTALVRWVAVISLVAAGSVRAQTTPPVDFVDAQTFATGLNTTNAGWSFAPWPAGTGAGFSNGGWSIGSPVYLCSPPGDNSRIFVVMQTGQIILFVNGVRQATPFLDIGNRSVVTPTADPNYPMRTPAPGTAYRLTPIGNPSGAFLIGTRNGTYTRGNEQGLLGMAFAPDYATSGSFYIYYIGPRGSTSDNSPQGQTYATRTDNGRSFLARYQRSAADPNLADVNSEQIILALDQSYTNHNGGCLQFGPDGYLYLGLGDGGSGNDPLNAALNPANMLGKLHRFDVSGVDDFPADPNRNYHIPADNPRFKPYATATEPQRLAPSSAWALGLRNPWRWCFDRWNGDLYIADVGQDAIEEVNWVAAGTGGGRNYGWRRYEGLATTANSNASSNPPVATTTYDITENLVNPVWTYGHGNGATQGNSITGGYVYRGKAIPWLRGRYFFADYVFSNRIWTMRIVGGAATDVQTYAAALQNLGSNAGVTSFGEDAAGELYIVLQGGTIRKIVRAATVPSLADVAGLGGTIGPDGQRTVDDIVTFLTLFFSGDQLADLASLGGVLTPDDQITVDDLVAFLSAFFQ